MISGGCIDSTYLSRETRVKIQVERELSRGGTGFAYNLRAGVSSFLSSTDHSQQ